MSLTMEERADVLEAWAKACKDLDIKIIAQVGGGPLDDVLKLVRYFKHLMLRKKLVTIHTTVGIGVALF